MLTYSHREWTTRAAFMPVKSLAEYQTLVRNGDAGYCLDRQSLQPVGSMQEDIPFAKLGMPSILDWDLYVDSLLEIARDPVGAKCVGIGQPVRERAKQAPTTEKE